MNVNLMHKTFDGKKESLSEKYSGKTLIGLFLHTNPPQTNKEGQTDELQKELQDWKNKGGKGFIQYNMNDNFKTGILTLSPIESKMQFIVCEGEDYPHQLKQNGTLGLMMYTQI